MDDIEAIERATLAAVPPQRLEECAGWLVALDDGTVGRAKSAVPLRHEGVDLASVALVEAMYAQAGLPPVFRVPDVAGLRALEVELEARGYHAHKPTLLQTCLPPSPLWGEGRGEGQGDLRTSGTVDPGFESVFLGEGFDPVDGASRVAILRRARDGVFATVQVEGETVAVGALAFGAGWAGVHGMRTLPAHRGRGHAGRIIATLAAQARARGIARLFLQVEEANAGARSLYARLGFRTAWCHRYWKR